MSKTPTVTVGMPAFDAERTIRESIDSILSQTFADFELIVSDNASTDGTEAICREYAERDPRVAYHRQARNLGAAENWNAVFRLANAPYFKWASSNDICMPEYLAQCVPVLQNRPDVVLCYGKTRLFDSRIDDARDYDDNLDLEDGDPLVRFKQCRERMALNNVMNGLIRTDALRRTCLMKSFYMSDSLLMAELALHGKFAEVPQFLFYRRMDPETATVLMSPEEKARFFNPAKTILRFQTWRMFAQDYAAAWRAPLAPPQRLRLCGRLLRETAWARSALLDDLKRAMGFTWRHGSRA